MTHASLFSGIGGFDLAAEWAGWTNVFNCEIDPFCRRVLSFHFPNAIQYEDIKTTDFRPFRGGGWMSSREVSHANRSASQESERELTITATSGRRCCEQYASLSLVGSWAKMFSELLIGRTDWYSSRCALIWRMKATRCSRILFRLVPSMLPTEEIECGSSPTVGMLKTPSVMDSSETLSCAKPNPTSGNSGCLAQEIVNGYVAKRGLMLPTVVTQGLKYCNEKGQSAFVPPVLLPTPTTNDSANSSIHPSQITRDNLAGAFLRGMLPTPRSQGEEGYKTRAERKGHECAMSYLESNIQYQLGSDSQLNPLFVAEMMGFPPDWTALPFLAGEEKA